MSKQECKVFVGGLSWETTGDKLRAYFENFGTVREAFVSYNRASGRPRGFGFVVFDSTEVADKVVAAKHTIDRREVEAKKAVAKEEASSGSQNGDAGPSSQKGRAFKVFIGGLPQQVDEKFLIEHFSQYGQVEDAVVMYDHENKRPRGFGFVTFTTEEAMNTVFANGPIQTLLDKQIEIKAAIPRDQMPFQRPPQPPAKQQYACPPPLLHHPASHMVSQPGAQQHLSAGPFSPALAGLTHPGPFMQHSIHTHASTQHAPSQHQGHHPHPAHLAASKHGKPTDIPGALGHKPFDVFDPSRFSQAGLGPFVRPPLLCEDELSATFNTAFTGLGLAQLGRSADVGPAFPTSFAPFSMSMPEASMPSLAHGPPGGCHVDFPPADGLKLGAQLLGADFKAFQEHSFTASPAPGWSS